MKKLIALIIITLPALCQAIEPAQLFKELSLQGAQVNDQTLLSEALSNIKEDLRNGADTRHYAKINKDASKIEAIKGVWLLNYKIANSAYTDKLSLTDTYTGTDGDIMASGLIYLNNIGAGSAVLCQHRPEVYNTINADYICLQLAQYSGLTLYNVYALRINGSSVSGYYGVGQISMAVSTLLNKTIPVTGVKQGATPVSPIPANPFLPVADTTVTGDEYNSVTQELTLPDVKVGNDKYSAILIYQGNDLFKIKSTTKK